MVKGPTWEEAEANAKKLGGHLVTINDKEEWDWFKSEFTSSKYGYEESFGTQPNGWNYPDGEVQFWIGLHDSISEGQHQWVSGETSSISLNDLSFSHGWEDDHDKNDFGVWQWEKQRITHYDNEYERRYSDGWTWWQNEIRGIAEIKIVSDSSVQASASLKVNPINDDPELIGTPWNPSDGYKNSAYVINEKDLLQGYADVDGDTLKIDNLKSSKGLIKSLDNGTWQLSPPHDFEGDIVLTYSVSDGNGGDVNSFQAITFKQAVLEGTNQTENLNGSGNDEWIYAYNGFDTIYSAGGKTAPMAAMEATPSMEALVMTSFMASRAATP